MSRAFALPLRTALLAVLVTGLPAPVLAGNDCPPGLAKKANGCTPPGLAQAGAVGQQKGKKAGRSDTRRYGVGERIDGPFSILRDPRRYRLDPDFKYARVGDRVYLIHPETREVLDVLGSISRLLD